MADLTQLLQQIVDNTSRDDSLLIAIVSGGAAVLGASVAAIFSYFTTERSIRFQHVIEHKRLKATIISTERLRYLQSLRASVADLYTQMDMQLSYLQRPVNASHVAQHQQILDEFSLKVMTGAHAIFPMLNRAKEDQRELSEAINTSLGLMQSYFPQKTLAPLVIILTPYSDSKKKAFNSLEAIGIKIWEKIKALE